MLHEKGMNKMRVRANALIILAVLTALAVTWLFLPVPCIVLENLDNGQIIFIQAVQPKDELTIGWTHSVEQLPWEEIFRVEGDNLILDRTRFKTFGAGVPSETLGKSKMEDGWIVYYDLEQKMPGLTYSISKRGRHILTYHNRSIPLYEVLPDATPVSVSARILSRIKLLQLSSSARIAIPE
jgi:hypothetical protein